MIEPVFFCGLKERKGSKYVGVEEFSWFNYASIHMRFSGKIYNPINIRFPKDILDDLFITDITFYKSVT